MSDATNQLVETDAKTVHQWIENGEAVLIDVREPQELQQARVPGAINIPMSAFDTTKLPDDAETKLVFLCAIGQRSSQVGVYLLQNDLIESAYNVTGGLNAWAQAGLPLEAG